MKKQTAIVFITIILLLMGCKNENKAQITEASDMTFSETQEMERNEIQTENTIASESVEQEKTGELTTIPALTEKDEKPVHHGELEEVEDGAGWG